MREILFRGKRIDNGEWIEGYYYKKPNPCSEDGKPVYHGISDLPPFGAEIIPETVGQYSSLKDKNGKRIFEGDIVKRCFTLIRGHSKKTREIQVGIVGYSNTECGFVLKNTCNLKKPWDGDTIEVIGNIHDNPELLGRCDNGSQAD